MTFKPSEEVLEQLADSQNSHIGVSQYNGDDNGVYNSAGNQTQDFSNDLQEQGGILGGSEPALDIPVEEVKAPDLSEILKQQKNNVSKTGESISSDVATDVGGNNGDKTSSLGIKQDGQNNMGYQELSEDVQNDKTSLGKTGPFVGKLSLLIDEQGYAAVNKYKILNRLLFRWGILACVIVIGIVLGMLLDNKFNQFKIAEVVKENTILNREKWVENTADKVLLDYMGSEGNFEVLVPFGYVSVNGDNVQSKSNLLSYKGVILPQLVSINVDVDDFMSLEDFNEGFSSRKDLENLLQYVVVGNSIGNRAKNLPEVSESFWVGNRFKEDSLIDGFSLGCLESNRLSNFLCDYFVGTFYRYGKYYDLSYYANDLLLIVKELKNQGKDIEPVCNMVIEYTQRSGNFSSDVLDYVMEYCNIDDLEYYRKLTNFISVDDSLKQPELSEEVFEDPDLNAYKLLTARQILYKKLALKTETEDYIKSYLNYVQALIKKDNGSNRYLSSIYKDMLYVFNVDILYPYLNENSFVNLRLQVDQINNGNIVYGYPSLLTQLTTVDIVKSNESSEIQLEDLRIEDIFEQYYYMTDRLKIRKVTKISENELKVQTELFTNKISSVTNGTTLKLTVSLYRNGNVLYVDNIKVANQVKFSEILNIYAKDGVTFYAMLNYIDDQIGMWYESPNKEPNQQRTLCEELQEREDVVVYSCDDTSILLYKGNIEYNFVLKDGVLDYFIIGDEDLNNLIWDKLGSAMFMRENTSTVVKSIISFEVEELEDGNVNEKLDIIDQFSIHFKIVPDDINKIEGKDSEFLIKFTLGEFNLQAEYNINTHLLTKISYIACDKVLEIRGLTIEISTDNESKLIEILNNPKVFFAQSNPAAYKKYQKMCNEDKKEVEK